MSIIKRVFNYVSYILFNRRLIYSYYVNFRLFPINIAKYLPIKIYKKSYLYVGAGAQLVLGETFNLKKDKILIGLPSNDFEYGHEETHLTITHGKMCVGGMLEIRKGCNIEVKGELNTGIDVVFAPRCRLRAHNKIEIGNFVRIAHETQIFDSNFHYIEKVDSPGFFPVSQPIYIGDYVWIGNRCTISARTVLPSTTIVTSNSLVNKSFLGIEPHSIIGGIPARFIKSGYSRVWDVQRELSYHLEEFKWRNH